jgi:hypothetical protein
MNSTFTNFTSWKIIGFASNNAGVVTINATSATLLGPVTAGTPTLVVSGLSIIVQITPAVVNTRWHATMHVNSISF